MVTAEAIGLEPLGTVPADLPDAWLLRLEAQAERLGRAQEAAEYETLQGREGPPASTFQRLAHAHVLTEALEAACAARLPLEAGPRHRWLEVLHAECQALRLACDPELQALTDEIERATWGFQPTPAPAGADQREVAHHRVTSAVPLAQQLREPTRQLVRRRNLLARAEGAPDFYALRCRWQDMPEAWHAPLLAALEGPTGEAMARVAAHVAALEGEPVRGMWQIRGCLRVNGAIPQERLPVVNRAGLRLINERLGLPDVSRVVKLDVGPFAAGGLCNVVDPAADVRILVADWLVGSGPYGVLLHEYGHARHAIGMAAGGHPYHLATMMKGALPP